MDKQAIHKAQIAFFIVLSPFISFFITLWNDRRI